MNLIVVSSHPVTQRLLTAAGYEFEYRKPSPQIANDKLPAVEYALSVARGRAKKVLETSQNAVVVSVAPVLTLNGKKIYPPQDEEQAVRQLLMLSGVLHKIYNGVAIFSQDHQSSFFSQAKVRMNTLSLDEIKRYVATGEAFSSAAGYSMLGKGASFVESVVGDWYAAAGAPLSELAKRLGRDYGIKAF